MIIFPAVDIRDGRAVRLRQGRKDEVTVFGDNPVQVALEWEKRGAEWLHLVDLDAAFGDKPNFDIVARITESLNIPVQLGGGIRNMDIAARYLAAGVERLIIGTLALEDSAAFGKICERFPGRIGVSLDGVNGMLKSRGWLTETKRHISDAVPELEKLGAAFIIYTDIERDGMQSGVNLDAVNALMELATVPVIIAGGVSCLNDVRMVHKLDHGKKLQGIISGRALYEKTLDLEEARKWLAQQDF